MNQIILRIFILSISFSFLFFLKTFSQNNQENFVFSLKECVEYALNNNPETKNKIIDAQIEDLKSKIAIAEYIPNINTKYNLTNNFERPTSFIPGAVFGSNQDFIPVKFGTTFDSNASINLTTKLNAELLVALKLLKLQRKLSTLNIEKSKEEITSNVYSSYHSVLLYDNLIETNKKIVSSLKENKNKLKRQSEEGLIPQIEVDKLELVIITTQNTINQFLGIRQVRLQTLKASMGIEKNKNLTLTQNFDFSLAFIADYVPQKDFQYDDLLTIKELKLVKELQETDVKRHKLKIYPSLTFSTGYIYSFQQNDLQKLYNVPTNSGNLKVDVSLPIFTGGKRTKNLQKAKLDLLKTENNIFHTKNNLDTQFSNYYAEYTHAQNSVITAIKSVDIQKEALRHSERKYFLGLTSSFEYITNQNEYIEKQIEYYNAVFNAINAKINLEKFLGKLLPN